LVPDTSVALLEHAKLRWRIERDCQELKQELGLSDPKAMSRRQYQHPR
jgi:SRSO17 transposase